MHGRAWCNVAGHTTGVYSSVKRGGVQVGHCLSLKIGLFFVQTAQEISNQLHTKNDVC